MSDVDDKLDAAWRAASREEPPVALDDALRAAARRAVGAGPSRARHMRSWPLAAAAVVTVLAIGIVQLIPPEQVTPTIVADGTLRQDALKEKDTMRPAAPAIDATVPQAAPPPLAATPPIDRASNVARKQIAQPTPAPPLVLADKASPPAPRGAGGVARGEMTAERERDAAEAKSKLENGAPDASAKKERAEPFPAAPAEAKVAADVSAAATPPAPAAPVAANRSAPALAGATSVAATRAAPSEVRARTPALLAKATPESERAKDSTPRTPDEWIKLIRRLQSEGRKDDVTKELAAFRAEYKERADSLLPADLRELK